MPWDHSKDEYVTTIYSTKYDKSFFQKIQGEYYKGDKETDDDDQNEQELSEVTRRVKIKFIEFDWHLKGAFASQFLDILSRFGRRHYFVPEQRRRDSVRHGHSPPEAR